MQPIRREQLIRAAVTTIDQLGLADTTIAQVAGTAGLSSGIVSHYFGDKSGLIHATMRQLLRELRGAIAKRRAVADDMPCVQLRAIIDGNFDESQINPAAMRIWLTFWAASLHQPDLARLQRANDRRLYSNLCWQFRRVLPLERARFAARGLAAMIDGLWLRGGLSGSGFDVGQARAIAYEYLDRQLDCQPKADA
jgi:TetR/AcrR family transcriptional repressor of bet genes